MIPESIDEVVGVDVTAELHGSLTEVGLTVAYHANPARLPAALCLEAAFEDHGIAVSMRSEATFHAVARPRIDVDAPACVLAEHHRGEGIVVMEDLLARGCAITHAVEPCDPDTVADALAQLASLHAGWWGEGLVPGIAAGATDHEVEALF